ELDKLLQEGLIQGKHPRVLARHLENRFGVSKSNAERLMRTELARVQTEAQKQSFEKNGFTKYQFLAIGSACGVCKAIDGKHFDVKDMMPGENAPPMHPNCRCSVSAWEDSKEYKEWLDYLDKGGTTEEWNKLKKNGKSVVKSGKSDIIKTKKQYGAWTDKNDPLNVKRSEIAEKLYKQITNRKKKFEIEAVAKNSGFDTEDIEKVYNHVFKREHRYRDGSIHKFHTDYYMAHSWIRLRNGKNIYPHDITMLRHELEEERIMKESLDLIYEDVHEIVQRKYNYQKELLEHLKNHDV
ncbi:MAG: minor capsid protein, partial [Anaerostipes sp.]|nr:minor capsid protein [Anaerostipes sp.]